MDEAIIDEVIQARAQAMDDARPEAVAKVHARGKFTARERIDRVLDEGSFVEYGALAIPANKSMTGPADGLVQGFGTVEGHPVGIASYDYTVQGGTQTALNHGKFDRLLDLVHDRRWPLITFADGGGARAHDLAGSQRGLTGRWGTFDGMAQLSGWVPTVSVVSGTIVCRQCIHCRTVRLHRGHARLGDWHGWAAVGRGRDGTEADTR